MAAKVTCFIVVSWWRHQMETFSALLAICAGNSPVTCEFTAQRLVTRSFDVFFDLLLDKQINGWVINREAGGLGRNRTHYDATVILWFTEKLVPVFVILHVMSMNVLIKGTWLCGNACLIGIVSWNKSYWILNPGSCDDDVMNFLSKRGHWQTMYVWYRLDLEFTTITP